MMPSQPPVHCYRVRYYTTIGVRFIDVWGWTAQDAQHIANHRIGHALAKENPNAGWSRTHSIKPWIRLRDLRAA